METTLYADVLFFVNFSMDFISLWAASLMCAAPRRAGRMSLAAALGGLYGVFAVILSLEGIFAYISAAAVSILMTLTAFGLPSGIFGLIRESAVVWGSGALLGGVMTALLSLFSGDFSQSATASPGGLIIAAALVTTYFIVRALTRRKNEETVRLSVFYGGKSVELTALCDSGNLLRDPISGDPVMTVSDSVMIPLMGREAVGALTSYSPENAENLPHGFRLIPRKAATGSDICAAFLPDKIIIKNKKSTAVRCLIAVSRCPADYFGGHPAVFPASALR